MGSGDLRQGWQRPDRRSLAAVFGTDYREASSTSSAASRCLGSRMRCEKPFTKRDEALTTRPSSTVRPTKRI